MPRRPLALILLVLLLAAACGDDDDAGTGGRPQVAVTTTVLGDVVRELLADQAEVVTIMPRGASPHDFQASARQAAALADADAIVVNGGGFEEGLLSVVDAAAADGVPVIDALDRAGAGDLDVTGDAEHDDDAEHDEEGDEHEHEGGAHFFTDPLLMAAAVDGIADALAAEVPELDPARLRASADELAAELEALHQELVEVLGAVPEDRRLLVTDHDVFGAFAARYGFEVVDTVIPAGTTSDGVSGGTLARLADTLREFGVRAVFTEATASAELAETLAAEVGDVEVVPLHAESLGPEGSPAATYAGMLRENAERIAAALAG